MFILAVTALMTAFLTTSCDEEETILNKQALALTIQGTVYDADGNVPLEGVTVISDSDTTTTDANGLYSIEKQATGSYVLKFSKEEYLEVYQNVAGQTDVSANESVISSSIKLYKADQSFSTTFLFENGETVTPVAEMPVTISFRYNTSFINNKIETVTDSEGKITVEGIAKSQSYIIEAVKVDGDYTYSRTITFSDADNLNDEYTVSRTKFDPTFYLESSNIFDEDGVEFELSPSDNITFSFSDNIDADFEDLEIEFSKFSPTSQDIVINATIADNTLTIDPLGSSLEAGATYNVSFIIASTQGVEIEASYSFTIEGEEEEEISLEQVTGLSAFGTDEITETTTDLYIEVDKVSNHDEILPVYEVFVKYSGGTDEFIEIESSTQVRSTTEDEVRISFDVNYSEIEEPEEGYFSDNQSFDIMVRVREGDIVGEFSDVLTLKAGDNAAYIQETLLEEVF